MAGTAWHKCAIAEATLPCRREMWRKDLRRLAPALYFCINIDSPCLTAVSQTQQIGGSTRTWAQPVNGQRPLLSLLPRLR